MAWLKTLAIVACTHCCVYQADGVEIARSVSTNELSHIKVEGGAFYEIALETALPKGDIPADAIVGVCYFKFFNGTKKLRPDNALISGFVPRDLYTAYEYLYYDLSARRDKSLKWRFQFRVPDDANEMLVWIKAWPSICGIDRVKFEVIKGDDTYDTLNDIPLKIRYTGSVCDNALTCEGRVSLEAPESGMTKVLVKVELQPWNDGLRTLGDCLEKRIKVNPDGRFRLDFDLPQDGYAGEVMVSASQACRIYGLKVYPRFKPVCLDRQNGAQLKVGVREGDRVWVRGTLSAEDSSVDKRAGIAFVSFRDAQGKKIDSGRLSKNKGREYFYMPVTEGELPFEQKIHVPKTAVSLEMALLKRNCKGALWLRDLDVETTVSDYRNLLIRELHGEVSEDAMLKRTDLVRLSVDEAFGVSPMALTNATLPYAENYRLVFGDIGFPKDDYTILSVRDFPQWELPSTLNWYEDPFHSKTWQMKFLSCYWIPFLSARDIEQGKRYWQSFFSCNTYPNRSKTMAYHDHICSMRIEAVLLTIFGLASEDQGVLPSWHDLLTRDPDFFYELLYQLLVDAGVVDYYLRSGKFVLHNHNLIMARALLTFSSCYGETPIATQYRHTAFRVFVSHMRAIFESDGFIREQSSQYHHSFLYYFFKIYCQLRRDSLTPQWLLDEMQCLLQRLISVDALLCPPDGKVVHMGDTGMIEIRNALVSLDGQLAKVGMSVGVPVFEQLPRVSFLRESGLCIFRNPQLGRFLFVDLSPVKKVHGHKDLGSWQYFSKGKRWVEDVGGPYKYGSKEDRMLASSESHTLLSPVGQGQMAGRAYGVELKECEFGWILSFKTNVYGSRYEHTKTFLVLRDISGFSVRDAFEGPEAMEYCGRVMCSAGVDPREVDASRKGLYRLEKESESIDLEISGDGLTSVSNAVSASSWTVNRMDMVNSIQYRLTPPGKSVQSVVNIYEETDAKEKLKAFHKQRQ